MLLLAGDQGDRAGALELDDPVVVLARQQPQREADHARAVAEHPLDGEVGLAGVGGPEDRGQLRVVRRTVEAVDISPQDRGFGGLTQGHRRGRGGPVRASLSGQAARIAERKSSTCLRSISDCCDRSPAADRTCVAAAPVSPTAAVTPAILRRHLAACPRRPAARCARFPASPHPAPRPPRRSWSRSR